MAQLASYSSLTKKQDEILVKGYCFGNALALALYRTAGTGIDFTGKVAVPHGAGSSSSKAQFGYKLGNFEVKETLTDKTAYKITCDYVSPKYKDVTLSGELNASPSGLQYSASVQQILSQARYKFTLNKALVASLSLVAGTPDKGLGLNLSFDAQEKKLKTYDATAYFKFGDVSAAVKHISKPGDSLQLGDLQFLYHQQLKSKIAVAAQATYNSLSEKKLFGEVAVLFDMGKSRSLSVKADSDLTVTTSHRLNLWENVQAIFAIRSPQKKIGATTEFGIKIKVNA